MPEVKPINIKAIFEQRTGRPMEPEAVTIISAPGMKPDVQTWIHRQRNKKKYGTA